MSAYNNPARFASTPRHDAELAQQFAAALSTLEDSDFAQYYRGFDRPDVGPVTLHVMHRLLEARTARGVMAIGQGEGFDPALDEWHNDTPWLLAGARDFASPSYNNLWQ